MSLSIHVPDTHTHSPSTAPHCFMCKRKRQGNTSMCQSVRQANPTFDELSPVTKRTAPILYYRRVQCNDALRYTRREHENAMVICNNRPSHPAGRLNHVPLWMSVTCLLCQFHSLICLTFPFVSMPPSTAMHLSSPKRFRHTPAILSVPHPAKTSASSSEHCGHRHVQIVGIRDV